MLGRSAERYPGTPEGKLKPKPSPKAKSHPKRFAQNFSRLQNHPLGIFQSAKLVKTFPASQEPLELTDMNPAYPPTSEAVDNHLKEAITSLDTTTREGFRDVKSQIRDMATKDAVEAHVARLDREIYHTNEKMDTGFEKFEKEMAKGFAELRVRDAARDQQFKDREDERDKKYSRRVGWTITSVGVGVSFVSFVITNWPK